MEAMNLHFAKSLKKYLLPLNVISQRLAVDEKFVFFAVWVRLKTEATKLFVTHIKDKHDFATIMTMFLM